MSPHGALSGVGHWHAGSRAFFPIAITAATNILPLILIPQIIMSGALIKFEDMNRQLDFYQSITRWFDRQPAEKRQKGARAEKLDTKMEVPLVCQLMPMRWSYEALVVAQAKSNPLASRQDAIQRRIAALTVPGRKRTLEDEALLDTDKELLATLSGLEGRTPRSVDRRLREIDSLAGRDLKGEPALKPDPNIRPNTAVTASALYVNEKISDMVSKAEMEQSDYRGGGRDRNVFFAPVKMVLGRPVSILLVNTSVLLAMTLAALLLLYRSLWKTLRKT